MFCLLFPLAADRICSSLNDGAVSKPVLSSPPRRHHSLPHSHHPHVGCSRMGSRSSSVVYTAFSPRPSISRHSSIATNPPMDRSKPKDYLVLAIIACFCPVWPINIVGFVYSIMVRRAWALWHRKDTQTTLDVPVWCLLKRYHPSDSFVPFFWECRISFVSLIYF